MVTDPQNPNQNQSPEMTTVGQIKQWYDATFPVPTGRQVQKQLAVHFREVSEILEILSDVGETSLAEKQLDFTHAALDYLQRQMRSSNLGIVLDNVDRRALLNALSGQIIAAIGVAHLMRMDIEGALQEVASSNVKSFRKYGRPVFNPSVGFTKRPSLPEADFAPFVSMPAKEA